MQEAEPGALQDLEPDAAPSLVVKPNEDDALAVADSKKDAAEADSKKDTAEDVAPDAAPIVETSSVRASRRARHSVHGSVFVGLVAFGMCAYGILIAPAVWWGSYMPLVDKLQRMEPLACNLTNAWCQTGDCCEESKSSEICVNRQYRFYTDWQLVWRSQRLTLPAPLMNQFCAGVDVTLNCTPYLQQLTSAWQEHHGCWIDPLEVDQVSLDLNDMRASVATTSARFVAAVFFFAVFCCGVVLVVAPVGCVKCLKK